MTTNSISNNYNIEQTKKYQSVPAQKADKTPNSIMDVSKKTDTEQTSTASKTEKLDNLLQEIATKYQKYGVSVDDLKKLQFINKIYNMNSEEVNNIPQERRENELKTIKESLICAIEDCISEDNVDLKKLEDVFLKYHIALNTGWKIKEFKKAQTTNNNGLLDTMRKYIGFPKDATLENTDPEVVKKYIRIACEEVLGKLETHPSQEKVKEQFKQFGVLLANSSDTEKKYFHEVVKSLPAESRYEGIKILFDSLKTKEAATKIADDWGQYGHSELTNDCNKEQSTAISIELTQNQSENGRIVAHKKNQEIYQNWFNANKEDIKAITQKIHDAKNNDVEPEFTEAEKQLLAQLKRLTGIASGEFIGTLVNDNITEDFKSTHLQTLNEDAYKREDYREILSQTHNYIEGHKDELINLPSKYETLLNEATNGNYTKIAIGSNEELSAPATTTASTKSEETTEAPAIGFTSRKPVEQTRVQVLKNEYVQSTEKAPEFRVENVTRPTSKTHVMVQKFEEAKSSQDRLAIIKEFFDKSTLLQNALEKYLLIATDPLRILNALPTNARTGLAHKLVRSGKLKEEEIEKLNLSFGAKQLMLNDLANVEKHKRNVQA